MKNPKNITNAMSVDVEDYFQVSAFEAQISRKDWSTIPCRVEANVDKVLELFSRKNIQATFFTLGWVAKRYPEIVRKIVGNGHELASHGWAHQRANTQTREEFREDVSSAKKLLEDISGESVKGYRAPSYSISSKNLWALDELAEAGYQYSSSIAPVHHDLYGIPKAPRFPFKVAKGNLIEIPISTVKIAGNNVHCSGGGWFRFFPYGFSRWAINQVNGNESQPCVFYFHPWEIDPDQPKIPGVSIKTRFRHYLNLGEMEKRLEKLLDDFSWGRVDNIFLSNDHPVHLQSTALEWAEYGIASS